MDCEQAGIAFTVSKPHTSNAAAVGRFDRANFVYHPDLRITENQSHRLAHTGERPRRDKLGISLREVNAAFAYNRYDSYRHFRRSRVMV